MPTEQRDPRGCFWGLRGVLLEWLNGHHRKNGRDGQRRASQGREGRRVPNNRHVYERRQGTNPIQRSTNKGRDRSLCVFPDGQYRAVVS